MPDKAGKIAVHRHRSPADSACLAVHFLRGVLYTSPVGSNAAPWNVSSVSAWVGVPAEERLLTSSRNNSQLRSEDSGEKGTDFHDTHEISKSKQQERIRFGGSSGDRFRRRVLGLVAGGKFRTGHGAARRPGDVLRRRGRGGRSGARAQG